MWYLATEGLSYPEFPDKYQGIYPISIISHYGGEYGSLLAICNTIKVEKGTWSQPTKGPFPRPATPLVPAMPRSCIPACWNSLYAEPSPRSIVASQRRIIFLCDTYIFSAVYLFLSAIHLLLSLTHTLLSAIYSSIPVPFMGQVSIDVAYSSPYNCCK